MLGSQLAEVIGIHIQRLIAKEDLTVRPASAKPRQRIIEVDIVVFGGN
jgi:hypothetical protein